MRSTSLLGTPVMYADFAMHWFNYLLTSDLHARRYCYKQCYLEISHFHALLYQFTTFMTSFFTPI